MSKQQNDLQTTEMMLGRKSVLQQLQQRKKQNEKLQPNIQNSSRSNLSRVSESLNQSENRYSKYIQEDNDDIISKLDSRRFSQKQFQENVDQSLQANFKDAFRKNSSIFDRLDSIINNSNDSGLKEGGQKYKNVAQGSDQKNSEEFNIQRQESQENSKDQDLLKKQEFFIKQLKDVHEIHLFYCFILMKTAIFVFFFEFVFSITCVIFFGCLFGSCTNNLVCFIHYIKFVHSIYMMYTYYNNIHEKQPNHPMSTINTFIVILIYNCCLYVYIGDQNPEEPATLIYYCSIYTGVEFLLLSLSMILIKFVKSKASGMIQNESFEEYTQEAELAMSEIRYLPQEFDSDQEDEQQ